MRMMTRGKHWREVCVKVYMYHRRRRSHNREILQHDERDNVSKQGLCETEIKSLGVIRTAKQEQTRSRTSREAFDERATGWLWNNLIHVLQTHCKVSFAYSCFWESWATASIAFIVHSISQYSRRGQPWKFWPKKDHVSLNMWVYYLETWNPCSLSLLRLIYPRRMSGPRPKGIKVICRSEGFNAPGDDCDLSNLMLWLDPFLCVVYWNWNQNLYVLDFSNEEPYLIKQVVKIAYTGQYQVPTEFILRDIIANTKSLSGEESTSNHANGGNNEAEFLRSPVYLHILMYRVTCRHNFWKLRMRWWAKIVGSVWHEMKWLTYVIREVYTLSLLANLMLRKMLVSLSKKLKLGVQSECTSAILQDPAFEKTPAFKHDLSRAMENHSLFEQLVTGMGRLEIEEWSFESLSAVMGRLELQE